MVTNSETTETEIHRKILQGDFIWPCNVKRIEHEKIKRNVDAQASKPNMLHAGRKEEEKKNKKGKGEQSNRAAVEMMSEMINDWLMNPSYALMC